MTARRGRPGQKEAGPPAKGPANAEGSSDTNTSSTESSGKRSGEPGETLTWVPCTWSHPQDPRSQLSRRRQTAIRSAPLDCGCSDPLLCRCTDPPLSDHAIDSWRDAALHILRNGHVPVLPIEARRALWRRGGPDRVLAELLHQACGGEAA